MAEEEKQCTQLQEEQRRLSFWLLSEKDSGTVHRLYYGLNKVGRHSTSDIKITNSSYVSRHHAEINVSSNDQDITIKDMQSMNGIYINTSQYNGCCVELHLGDIIGFGINGIDNNELNLDSNLPVFKLTKLSNNSVIIISDDDDDDDDDVAIGHKTDNSIDISSSNNHEQQQNMQQEHQILFNLDIHQPIISNIKKEAVKVTSNNIIDIFGAPDEDIQNQLKAINPLVYNDINGRPLLMPVNDGQKPLLNGEFISINDDEQVDTTLTTTTSMKTATAMTATTVITPAENATSSIAKSPNIFENCLNNENEQNNCNGNGNNNGNGNEDANDYNEELMFSQVLLEDIKAEFQDVVQDELEIDEDINGNETDIHIPTAADIGTQHTITASPKKNIKQEPNTHSFNPICFSSSFTQEILAKPTKELDPKICWTISDDEESDKELEEKVNCWSQRLFSQNKSQIFELNTFNNADEQFDDDSVNSTHNQEIKEILFKAIKERLEEGDSNLDEQESQSNKSNVKKKLTKQSTIQEELPSTSKSSFLHLQNSTNRVTKKEDNERKENVQSMANQFISTKSQQQQHQKLQNLSNEASDSEPCKAKEDHVKTLKLKSSDDKGSSVSHNNKIKMDKFKQKYESAIKKKSAPIIINAPRLPERKKKNCDVSSQEKLARKCSSVIEKIRHEEITKDLQRKWSEKPKTNSKSHQLTSKAKIQLSERRKKRLKELALKEKTDSRKRKIVENKDKMTEDVSQKKKVKVKVTENNRGVFLSENIPPPPTPHSSGKHHQLRRLSISLEAKSLNETFSQQISKPDQILIEQQQLKKKLTEKSSHSAEPSNEKTKKVYKTISNSSEMNTVGLDATPTKSTIILQKTNEKPKVIDKAKEMARTYRTTNKLTFASMEKYFQDSMKSVKNTSINKRKKKVRFNDAPIIYYIEAVPGAKRKISAKDFVPLSSYGERRLFIRNKYPIIDRTDNIINDILQWSNQWFFNRSKGINMSTNIVAEMMPYQFTTFAQYQRVFLSLMQLEYISKLERSYSATENLSKFEVHLQHIIPLQERLTLITQYKFDQKCKESYSRYELVLLERPELKQQMFGYISSYRKGANNDSTYIIAFDILKYPNFQLDQFRLGQTLLIRPAMDYIRTEFGSFNAIYQLENTPLSDIILNPMKLLEYNEPKRRGRDLTYKGCDALNERQEEILLNTYARIIDETQPNVTLIQGPPGTGKSVVITNLALQLLYGEDVRFLDKKILICAQSNAAVDVITSNLYSIILRIRNYNTRFRLIRFGNWDKINANVKYVALENVVIRDQMKQLVNEKKLSYVPPPLQSKEDLHKLILQLEYDILNVNAKANKTAQNENELALKQRDLQSLRNLLNEIRLPESKRKIFSYYLTRANIICTTLPSCVALSQYVDYFDVCIIDEATQCIEPWSLLPLKFGINSLVLVGDTEQLPATVFSQKANDFGLGTSMFTRLQRCLENNIPNHISTSDYVYCLNVQYRMHPEICLWPNKYFYKNELINGPNTEWTQNGERIVLQPFTILNLSYSQNDCCANGLIINDLEAEFVVQLLKVLHEYIPNDINSYGVITPYAQQRNTLEKSIRPLNFPNVMINTIDSYQGTEKDVIIISNARTNGIGFLSNPQRLNVALTRSRKLLILCGNFTQLQTIPVWRSLMENGRSRNLYYEISPNCVKDLKTNLIEKIICKQNL